MVRDDLYITVPSYFRCPISLDVMESPVSLCTGVTYDRRNIQRWLDAGNNTCPATMQVLQTQELLPNHTLHRLINIWSESLLNCHHSPPISSESISRDQAEKVILQLETGLKSLHGISSDLFCGVGNNLSTLISFANESDGNAKFIAAAAGGRVLSLLISVIIDKQSITNLNLLEKILLFCNIILKNRPKLNPQATALVSDIEMGKCEFKAAIMTGLKQGRLELRIAVAEFLDLMATHLDLEMKRSSSSSSITEDDEIYSELLSLIASCNWNIDALEASLKLLTRLMSCTKNRAKMVRAGGVNVLTMALSEAALSTPLTEKVLKLIEMASSCREGRNAICGNESCVQTILKKVLKISNTATEHAVTVLWTLCCSFGNDRVAAAVAKSNGMAKILLLLQSNISPAVRQMCGDLLRMFRCNSKTSGLSCYDTKTSHIMPF